MCFAKNMSALDRILRAIVGLVFLVLGWTGMVSGGLGIFLKWFGFVPLITGLAGFCPLYTLLKFRTNKG